MFELKSLEDNTAANSALMSAAGEVLQASLFS